MCQALTDCSMPVVHRDLQYTAHLHSKASLAHSYSAAETGTGTVAGTAPAAGTGTAVEIVRTHL